MRRHARAALLLAAAGPLFASGCHKGGRETSSPAPGLVAAPVPRMPAVRFALPAVEAPAVREATAPISLVSRDGRALALDSFHARAVVEGPLAFTEVRVTFENPEARVLEGTFRVTLPPGASLARLAMKIDDRFQEGEVVEKTRARAAYDDFLHRRQDPALLESSAPNEVSVRVFPIPAHAKKELVVAWSHELGAQGEYFLPLVGLPRARELSAEVVADGKTLAAISLAGEAPTRDLRAPAPSPAAALRAGDLTALRVTPVESAAPDPLASTVVLVDTSASRALGLARELELAAATVAAIARRAPDARVSIAAFDQGVALVYEGPARDVDASTFAPLVARGALGASDLEAGLRFAGAAARRIGAKRVVLVGDGVATAGRTDRKALGDAVLALSDPGVERLDVIAIGGLRDDAELRRLTTMGLRRDGAVVDGARPNSEITAALERASRTVDVRVEGATWQWPHRLEGLQPGDARYVYARIPRAGDVRVAMGDRSVVATAKPGSRGLVERSWASAKVDSLADREAFEGPSDARRREITQLSMRHRLVGPFTALIVLETEGDYVRWGIDRAAPATLLTVSRGAIVEYERAAPKAGPAAAQLDPRTPTAPWGASDAPATNATGSMWGDAIGDSFGAGGLGLSGTGEGGGGRGDGIGLGSAGTIGHGAGRAPGAAPPASGAHRTRPPQIRAAAAAEVSGRMPPEVIQRIIRMNFGRFRACYEAALRRAPDAEGRVVTAFMIDRTGGVSAARDAGSTLKDPAMLNCVQSAFMMLSFPAPESGAVSVVYPLAFQNDDRGTTRAPEREGTAPSGPWQRSQPASTPATYEGTFARVMGALEANDPARAFELASRWRAKEPGDVLAAVALGEAFEALGERAQAARAYGSILDLFAARADLRRFAAARLSRVAQKGEGDPALSLAADALEKAVDDRPDHPSGHRMAAIAHARLGQYERAVTDLERALGKGFPAWRFPGAERVLREDLAIVGAAWLRKEPARGDAIRARLRASGVEPAAKPSVRFVLSWETDANDVDFHIRDARGDHAHFGARALPSGGELFADVRTGYGPECFAIDGPATAGPYQLSAHYYSKGPMGFGLGALSILRHDGRGALTFDERPFVVQGDGATVLLGSYE